MKFGAAIAPKIDDWQYFKYAEDLGYDSAWVPDSQMIWSDCYAVLALAAWHTSTIRLGTGVGIAPTRLAPVTSASIASINRLAPGRTFLGIGTGHTSMRAMGHEPMKGADFREYLRVLRALLDGDEVDYTLNGETRAIRFLHEDMGFIDTAHRIPIYVGADGPMALKAAGAYGDGRISGLDPTPDRLKASIVLMHEGAAAAGRQLGDPHVTGMVSACVLQPGEDPGSDRVVDCVGATVVGVLHFWHDIYAQSGDDSFIAETCRDEWNDYLALVKSWNIPIEKRYQRLHMGHATFMMPEERKLVTPALIQASGALVGTANEIIERIKEQEEAGLREVLLLPTEAEARTVLKEFAEHVIARY